MRQRFRRLETLVNKQPVPKETLMRHHPHDTQLLLFLGQLEAGTFLEWKLRPVGFIF